jgi:hypothetical protein
MRGIEANAEEVGLAVMRRIGAESAVDLGKFVADARAEVGKRAAGVDQRQQQGLAAILAQRNTFSVLIRQLKVRYLVARLRDMNTCRGLRDG